MTLNCITYENYAIEKSSIPSLTKPTNFISWEKKNQMT